ncbi:MAG: glutaredoxin 3 [Halioglobus sp.]|nr:glutaredoxin 3 [Halioglobus sp.]
MYSTASCPYCSAARMLLTKKKIPFKDISVAGDDDLRAEMESRSGRRTVPQIFINDQPVGGFDDIYKLDQQGELDRLLGLTDQEPAQ